MKNTARPKIIVSADGKGLVSQGLSQALGRWRAQPSWATMIKAISPSLVNQTLDLRRPWFAN